MIASAAALALIVAAPVDVALDPLRGADYVAARAELLRTLRDPAAQRRWTEHVARLDPNGAAWAERVWHEAVLHRLADPRVDALIDTLPGLDPRVYLNGRVPRPMVEIDLHRAGVPAPVLMERYRKTRQIALPTPADRYPAGTPPSRVTALRRAEGDALADALLLAIGRSDHWAAARFLAQVAAEDPRPEARRVALIALGLGRDPQALATLETYLGSPDPGTSTAAALGLGRHRRAEAIDLLIGAVRAHPDPDTRRAAAVQLGALANRRSAPEGDRPALRARAARALAEVLLDPRLDDADAARLAEAAAAADHPELWAILEARLEGGALPPRDRRRIERTLRYRTLRERRARP